MCSPAKFRTIAVALGLAALAALLDVAPVERAQAFDRTVSASDTSVPLWWPESKRNVEFRVNRASADPVPKSDVELAINRALENWSFAGDCTDIRLTQGPETASTVTNLVGGRPNEADRINTIVWRNTDWPSDAMDFTDTDTIAITTVAYLPDTGEISDADIDVNEKFFTWSASATPPEGANVQDVQNVITHELGHAIGLAHSSIPTASMWARSSPGNIEMRTLDEDDIDAVCTVYPIGAPTPKERSSVGLTSSNTCSVGATPGRPMPLFLFAVACLVGWRSRSKFRRD